MAFLNPLAFAYCVSKATLKTKFKMPKMQDKINITLYLLFKELDQIFKRGGG